MEKKEEQTPTLPINDEILGGIKAAIERKEDLKSAMMTFYRAGYSKQEIEDAARRYLEGKKQGEYVEKEIKKILPEKKPLKILKGGTTTETSPINKKPLVQEKPKAVQKVSNYDLPKRKKPFSATTIILILILIFLVGILVTVFLFKDELIDLINKLFG